MANLKELDLSRCSKITDAGVRHLLSLPALEKLWISETGVTADGVTVLSSLSNLLLLDLGNIPVTDSALNSLQVRNLNLSLSLIFHEGWNSCCYTKVFLPYLKDSSFKSVLSLSIFK